MDVSLSVIVAVTMVPLVVLLASGTLIGFAMGATALLGLYLFLGGKLTLIGVTLWNSSNSFVLTAVPLFIFMGEVLLDSGLGGRVYRGITTWFGRVPGGLAHANIVACSVFAAISGSSVATAATIGTVAIPEMLKRGYDRKLVFGSLAAGGTLGILIPPSIGMILYGAMCCISVGRLFMAGLIPGIILALLFMAYIGVISWVRPGLTPKGVAFTWKEKASAVRLVAPALLLIIVILGGIYAGVMTPSEAAAVGASSAILLSLGYRRFSWRGLQKCLLRATVTTSMIMFIVVTAQLLSSVLSNLFVAEQLLEWVSAIAVSPIVILVCIYLMYMLMGCFFEGTALLLMTVPLVHPVIVGLGFNEVWFGVVLVLLIEMALITPPVGMNLYVIHGISGEHPISEVILGAVPFFGIMCVGLAIFTAFPQLSLWLPSQMIVR